MLSLVLRIARGSATPSTSRGQAGMSRTPSSWTVDMSTRRSNLDKLSSGEAISIFDLLSVDTDSYDWFMIEAILEAGYRPRVICIEINSSSV